MRLVVVTDGLFENRTRGSGLSRGIVRCHDQSEAVVALGVTLDPTLSGQSREGVGYRGSGGRRHDVDQQAIADQESHEWLAVVRGALLANDDRLKDLIGALAAERAANEAGDLVGVNRIQSIASASAQ